MDIKILKRYERIAKTYTKRRSTIMIADIAELGSHYFEEYWNIYTYHKPRLTKQPSKLLFFQLLILWSLTCQYKMRLTVILILLLISTASAQKYELPSASDEYKFWITLVIFIAILAVIVMIICFCCCLRIRVIKSNLGMPPFWPKVSYRGYISPKIIDWE